jgi:hypothetical protein
MIASKLGELLSAIVENRGGAGGSLGVIAAGAHCRCRAAGSKRISAPAASRTRASPTALKSRSRSAVTISLAENAPNSAVLM